MNAEIKKKLFNEFSDEFKSYTTDWYRIAEVNQFPDKYSDDEMERKKIKRFCEVIAEFRKLPTSPKSLRAFAQSISYSHTQLSNIENQKIKKLPIDRLESIALRYSSSVAYLIGLTTDIDYTPDKLETFFWEHPNSKYKAIEYEIRQKNIIEEEPQQMIRAEPLPIDILKTEIGNRIGNNYELALSIYTILSKPSHKRKNYIKILEYLHQI